MEHPQIEDEAVIDRYLVGKLSALEEEHFEEHLFACTDCLEKVQWGEELRRGLRGVATEDAARAAVSIGFVAWLRSRRPSQLAGLLSLALALVVLPVIVLRQQAELGQLRTTVSAAASASSSGLSEPVGSLSVVTLGTVRGSGAEVVELRPDANKKVLLLSLELPIVTAPRYRVTLRNALGQALWFGEGLEPTLYDTLLVVMPTTFLLPGDYRFDLEAVSPNGSESAGEMKFRILDRP